MDKMELQTRPPLGFLKGQEETMYMQHVVRVGSKCSTNGSRNEDTAFFRGEIQKHVAPSETAGPRRVTGEPSPPAD